MLVQSVFRYPLEFPKCLQLKLLSSSSSYYQIYQLLSNDYVLLILSLVSRPKWNLVFYNQSNPINYFFAHFFMDYFFSSIGPQSIVWDFQKERLHFLLKTAQHSHSTSSSLGLASFPTHEQLCSSLLSASSFCNMNRIKFDFKWQCKYVETSIDRDGHFIYIIKIKEQRMRAC